MIVALALGCGGAPPPPAREPPPTPEALARACAEAMGERKIEEVAPGILVARGYDLANTTVLLGEGGVVVVDPGMSTDRAREVRAALADRLTGPVRAVIYTHAHIDHVGGAEPWVDEGAQVVATDRWRASFFDQYGLTLPSEAARGARQFGRDLDPESQGCSSIGRPVDFDAARRPGVVLPDTTFADTLDLEVAGLRLHLFASPGETEDALMVWLPERSALLAGDDFYRSFPNLYTIRGTTPRPIDGWIASLDAARRLDPEVLIPSHTGPVIGREEVRAALRDYADAIRFVRDEVVRGANQGRRLDELAHATHLPPHLARSPYLPEVYGQVDWSVRALYTARVGWFDGRATSLYPLPGDELARRTVEAMGGAEAVLARAREARAEDPRWAAQLLAWLEDAGAAEAAALNEELAATYEALAAPVGNSNGRSYLLQSAHERRHGVAALGEPTLSEEFVAGLPVEQVLATLATRLRPDEAREVEESVAFVFEDLGERYVLTVRRGVAELVAGDPLPGGPAPVATLRTDGVTWRRIAVRQEEPLAALAAGRLRVEGSLAGLWSFLGRFDSGLAAPPTTLP